MELSLILFEKPLKIDFNTGISFSSSLFIVIPFYLNGIGWNVYFFHPQNKLFPKKFRPSHPQSPPPFDYRVEREVRHMAAQDLTQSTLQLVFLTGVDPESGNSTYKNKSFNNVKTSATADQLYEIAIAFEGLQQHPLTQINRRDNSEIREG